ncbi:MAG: hypothetical protein Q7S40_01720 [Opitutaceae bacterium]|nr:hypothetical protein [Opitutaceae bacterium]
MRIFTFPALLAAALVSAVVALPFFAGAKFQPVLYAVEAELASSVAGNVQLYYDDGSGFSEEASARVAVTPGTTAARYRFGIPPATFRAFRFDPLDRAGTVRIGALRVLTPSGKVWRELPLAEFKADFQIASLRMDRGALEVVTAPQSDDPQMTLTFSSPFVVPARLRDHAWHLVPRALPIFLALVGLLIALDRIPRLRAKCSAAIGTLGARPVRAVFFVALVATIFSAYPVLFLGKSHVSPNLGTVLLYDTYPTLPGYADATMVDARLSDVGAVMWQHVPFSMMQHRALRQGELPLWNRYNAAGVPLLAQGQSMFGDPLHFLVIAANGRAWAWDLKYLIAKWLFAAGLGLIVLAVSRDQGTARDQGTKRLKDQGTPSHETVHEQASMSGPLVPWSLGLLVPALLVSAAAPFIGFFLYRINHPAFFSVCYAPWPLYCLLRIAQADGRRSVAAWCVGLIVANLALMNSGTVKEAYMLLVTVNFAGACVLLATRASWRERLAKLAAVAWAGAIFILLTAPIWATFLATLKSAYTGYNTASAYQIQPTLLLGFFDEIFYRPLMSEDRVFNPSLNFVLLFGFLYFLATLREHFTRPVVIALAASSLLPLALAFGFVSPELIAGVPFLANVAHVDNTFSCALIVLWTVLAGVGFATASRRLGAPEGRADIVIILLILGALVFGWVAFGQAQHRPILGPTVTVNQPGQVLPVSAFIWDYLIALLVAVVVLALTVRRIAVEGRLTGARVLLVVACGLALLWRHGLHASAVGFDTYTVQPTPRVNFHARSAAVDFVRAAQAREPARGFGLRGNFFPGWSGVYGLETVHGPDALVNPWLRELIGVSGIERIWDWRLYVQPGNVGAARPFLDALNVRYYFDLQSDQGVMGRALKLLKAADLDVYESPTAWPRAFFTDRVAVYDEPAELIALIKTASGKPLAAIQKSDTDATRITTGVRREIASRAVVAATDYRLTENSTHLRVHSDGPGIVVLTEAFWAGDSRAEVDGVTVPVVRINHAFKGIVLASAGDHHVTFRYWPRNFFRNLMLSALGAVFFAGSLVLAFRRPKHGGSTPPRPSVSTSAANIGQGVHRSDDQ